MSKEALGGLWEDGDSHSAVERRESAGIPRLRRVHTYCWEKPQRKYAEQTGLPACAITNDDEFPGSGSYQNGELAGRAE